MDSFYTLHVAGITRELPIMKIADDLAIASFVILGDSEIVTKLLRYWKKNYLRSIILLRLKQKVFRWLRKYVAYVIFQLISLQEKISNHTWIILL